jgi:predicted nucleic acid-binding protein
VKFLLDTCVLSELVKRVPETQVLKWLQENKAHELCISAMTLAELQRGVVRMPKSKRQLELAEWLLNLEIGFEDRILAFDHLVAKVWAEMTSEAEAQGKSMTSFDSIIAATARAHGCKLVTRNIKDFKNARIEVINPWVAQ